MVTMATVPAVVAAAAAAAATAITATMTTTTATFTSAIYRNTKKKNCSSLQPLLDSIFLNWIQNDMMVHCNRHQNWKKKLFLISKKTDKKPSRPLQQLPIKMYVILATSYCSRSIKIARLVIFSQQSLLSSINNDDNNNITIN